MRRLLVRPGAIGDCLLALPALEYLKAEYTEVWVPSAVTPLIQFADRVRSLAATGIDAAGVGDRETDEAFGEAIRSFDEVVSWYGTGRPEFRDYLVGLNPQCIFRAALPPPNGQIHATDFFAEQVGAPAGQYARLRLEPRARRPVIAIHPFSGSERKNWPLVKYKELAARLDCAVRWIAGPEQQFDGALRFENLLELAEHIAGCMRYVGNDSGITHLAAATGVATIALFGPTDKRIWAPRGDNVTVIDHQPLEELAVETVLKAISPRLG